MVLVQRKVKVVFLIQSSRTLTQIRNFINNNVYPEWDTALSTAFTGYQFANTVVSIIKVPYIRQITANTWEVYPKYVYQGEVTGATADDARTRQAAFIEDAKTRTRNLLAGLTGTTVTRIFKDNVDGTTVESDT